MEQVEGSYFIEETQRGRSYEGCVRIGDREIDFRFDLRRSFDSFNSPQDALTASNTRINFSYGNVPISDERTLAYFTRLVGEHAAEYHGRHKDPMHLMIVAKIRVLADSDPRGWKRALNLIDQYMPKFVRSLPWSDSTAKFPLDEDLEFIMETL